MAGRAPKIWRDLVADKPVRRRKADAAQPSQKAKQRSFIVEASQVEGFVILHVKSDAGSRRYRVPQEPLEIPSFNPAAASGSDGREIEHHKNRLSLPKPKPKAT